MRCARIITAALNSIPKDSPIASTLRSQIASINWCSGYAEPGYDTDGFVVFGNWNDVGADYVNGRWEHKYKEGRIPSRLAKLFEKSGHSIEWEDEWTTCSECGRAVRTSADSYHWQPSYVWANECTILCLECAEADADSVIEQYVNNPKKCVPEGLRDALVKAGFEQVNDEKYENGWHPGQTDNPEKIFAEYTNDWDELVFFHDEQSQFYIRFSLWGRGRKEIES